MVEVFDLQGNRRDFEHLRQTYGNIRILDAGPDRKFKLVRIRETVGPSVIHVTVLDESGNPLVNQAVVNRWPDPNLPPVQAQTRWHDRGIVQKTDQRGLSGFGVGTGSYIRNLAEGGAHTLWVAANDLPSDGLTGVGMLGGTEHQGPFDITFQIARGETAQTEEPAEEPAEEPQDETAPTVPADPQPLPEAQGELSTQLAAIQDDLRRIKEHLGIT